LSRPPADRGVGQGSRDAAQTLREAGRAEQDETTEVSNIQCSGSARPNGGYISFYAPNNTGQRHFTYTISDGRGGTASAEIVVGIYVWC